MSDQFSHLPVNQQELERPTWGEEAPRVVFSNKVWQGMPFQHKPAERVSNPFNPAGSS